MEGRVSCWEKSRWPHFPPWPDFQCPHSTFHISLTVLLFYDPVSSQSVQLFFGKHSPINPPKKKLVMKEKGWSGGTQTFGAQKNTTVNEWWRDCASSQCENNIYGPIYGSLYHSTPTLPYTLCRMDDGDPRCELTGRQEQQEIKQELRGYSSLRRHRLPALWNAAGLDQLELNRLRCSSNHAELSDGTSLLNILHFHSWIQTCSVTLFYFINTPMYLRYNVKQLCRQLLFVNSCCLRLSG